MYDTNICLDHVFGDRKSSQVSAEAMSLASVGAVDGHIAAASVTDIHYILLGDENKRFDEQASRAALSNLFKCLTVVGETSDDCRAPLTSDMEDYGDAAITMAARRAGVLYIVTSDKKFLKHSSSTQQIITPVRLIEICSELKAKHRPDPAGHPSAGGPPGHGAPGAPAGSGPASPPR
jgi:predicted nucleic acid-binding protein